jgi:hypothetical protein
LLSFHFRPEKFFGRREGLRRGERDRDRARVFSVESLGPVGGSLLGGAGDFACSRSGEGDGMVTEDGSEVQNNARQKENDSSVVKSRFET